MKRRKIIELGRLDAADQAQNVGWISNVGGATCLAPVPGYALAAHADDGVALFLKQLAQVSPVLSLGADDQSFGHFKSAQSAAAGKEVSLLTAEIASLFPEYCVGNARVVPGRRPAVAPGLQFR